MSKVEVFDALKYRIKTNRFGTRFYYNTNGQLHRTDGPALEYADGSKSWYQNGEYHRTDGPAIEWFNGHFEWWVNGEELTEAEFNQRVKLL